MGVSEHTQRAMADAAQLYLDGKLTQAALRARLQRLQREDEEASRQPREGAVDAAEMDARDDDTEARLLDRLERDGLLKDGMTATDARRSLDG